MRTLQHPVQHMLVSHIIDSASGNEVVTRTKALVPLHDGGIADIAYRDVLVRTPGRVAHQGQVHPQLPVARPLAVSRDRPARAVPLYAVRMFEFYGKGSVMDKPTRERGERRFLPGLKAGVSTPRLR